MKFFIMLSKKNLFIITALVIIFLLVLGEVYSADSKAADGSTNAERISYIKSLGLEVDDSNASSKEITIPYDFGEVYGNYNKLQKKSGFDLSRYKGEKATVYTYPLIDDDNVQVHLIIIKGKVVGGDIADLALSGEMKPLKSNNI